MYQFLLFNVAIKILDQKKKNLTKPHSRYIQKEKAKNPVKQCDISASSLLLYSVNIRQGYNKKNSTDVTVYNIMDTRNWMYW